MNKKILLISIISFLMLLTISYASAVNTNTSDVERKESPLYIIRTSRATTKIIGTITEKINTKFLGERIFFMPLIMQKWASGTLFATFVTDPTSQQSCCPATCYTNLACITCVGIKCT